MPCAQLSGFCTAESGIKSFSSASALRSCAKAGCQSRVSASADAPTRCQSIGQTVLPQSARDTVLAASTRNRLCVRPRVDRRANKPILLFRGKANCAACHDPERAFSDGGFHDTGVGAAHVPPAFAGAARGQDGGRGMTSFVAAVLFLEAVPVYLILNAEYRGIPLSPRALAVSVASLLAVAVLNLLAVVLPMRWGTRKLEALEI